MENIAVKSTATLIDELITTSIRCWFAQERVMAGGTDAEVAEAAILAQRTNARRNALKRAIDERLGETDIMEFRKSYV